MGKIKEKNNLKSEFEAEEPGSISIYSAIMLVLMLFSWTAKLADVSVVDANIPIPSFALNIMTIVSSLGSVLSIRMDDYRNKRNKMTFNTKEQKKKYNEFIHDKYYGKRNEKKIHPLHDTKRTINKLNSSEVDEDMYVLYGGVKLIASIVASPFILLSNVIKNIYKGTKFNNSIKVVSEADIIPKEETPDGQKLASITKSLEKVRNNKEAYTVYLNKENPLKQVIRMAIHVKWKAMSIDDEDTRNRYLNNLDEICDLMVRSLDLSGSRLKEATEYVTEQLSSMEQKIKVEMSEAAESFARCEARELNVYNVYVKINKKP